MFCFVAHVVWSILIFVTSFSDLYTKSTQEWACLPGSRLRQVASKLILLNIRLNRLDMIGYDWILTMPCS